MFHDIIISRKTHYLEIIHIIHSCKIYVSRLRFAMYPMFAMLNSVILTRPIVWSADCLRLLMMNVA